MNKWTWSRVCFIVGIKLTESESESEIMSESDSASDPESVS